jgi:hypothetical protein
MLSRIWATLTSATARQIYFLLLAAIFAIYTVINVFAHAEQFSSFGVALVLIVGVCLLWWLIDRYLLVGFDTLEELKKGNIAVGLLVLAFSILIGSALIAAFVVWR